MSLKANKTLYFISLIPPEPILSEVKAFKEDLFRKYQTKVALNSPAHITLYPPFEWPPEEEALLKNTLHNFAKMQSSLEIQLQGFGCFAPRVIFVKPMPNENLNNLRQELFQYLQQEIQVYEKRYAQQTFNPHITIANRDLKREDFNQAWDEFKAQAYEKKFLADKIYLLKHNGRHWDIFQAYEFNSKMP